MTSNDFSRFKIEGTEVGAFRAPYVIAEIAQTHEGSLGNAMAFIEVAKECGADAVKFQTHIASEESTPAEPWRKAFSRQDSSRYHYWKRIEFNFEEWRILKDYADELGIDFISSAFSPKACEWLSQLGMRTWKVASGEIYNAQFIDWIVETGDAIILSTGLSDSQDFRPVLRKIIDAGNPVALLHCTTQYPTASDQVGLNIFSEFYREFPDIPIGLSDHSGEIYPAIVSTYLGAQILEVHLTLHDKMFGPDVPASLSPDQLKQMIQGVNFAWSMRENPVIKDAQLAGLRREKSIFTRSLVARNDIKKGEVLSLDSVAYKKPGGGLPYEKVNALVGKIVQRSIKKNELIKETDVR